MEKEVNSIISHLENGFSELRELISARDELYYSKSNRWQESYDGLNFLDKTIKIEDMMHELELIIDKIKSVIYE